MKSRFLSICMSGILAVATMGTTLFPSAVTTMADNGQNGLCLVDGKWAYYSGGKVDEKFIGFVDYQEGKFAVAGGTVEITANGPVQDPQDTSIWYFCAEGQVQSKYTGLAQYKEKWFYVADGKLDTNFSGLVNYDGSKFIVAAGQIKTEVNGLWQNAASIGGDDAWYYCAGGQVQTQYTGLAQYDGSWFYVAAGKLAENFTGTVEYDGATFNVANGTVVDYAVRESIKADDAIVQVSTIGNVDLDGAKISTIVIEYNVDLTGAELTTDMFDVQSYATDQGDENCALGSDPGKPLAIYVNDKPEADENGGSGTGKYVIIEVNTDYQLASHTGGAGAYNVVMCASVKQVGCIMSDSVSIIPATQVVKNYTPTEVTQYGSKVIRNYANEGQYDIQGLDVFELHTKDGSTGYEAYHATNCFDEATGEYSDVDLPYALYVPDDYDPSKKYALVLHVHDASAMGDNPLITLTESKAPVNYASDEVQQMVKDQGLGGLIVVAPQFNDSIRTTRDNWSLSCGVSATWQLLDSLTEEYNIDMDRIYASGQSMGGMQIMAMAQQRDNYFAALWPIASQWGTNYNLTTEYQGSVYYPTPADGTIVWKTDADGNEVDYRNMYYMLSDDNILVLDCADDMLSTLLWREFYLLYKDLVGVEIPKGYWNPLTLTAEEQDVELEKLLSQDNEIGIYWAVMEGGSHGDSWVYAHKIMGCYEWLLSQTRETEMERDKLDLNKPFELADEQIQDEERLMISREADETREEGFTIYYKTGKAGSGTLGYNSTLYGRGGQTIEALPGWDPDDTSTYGLGYYVFSFD